MNQAKSFNPQDFVILIVDDLKQNLKLLNVILEDQGYQTSLALNAKDALERLKVITPDLILLDLMMPDISGLEACQIIKSENKYKNIPIMFLTASNEEIHLKEAYKLGAEDYITKPFRKDELLGRIKTQLTLISQSRYISELEQEIEKLISLKS
jgi:CheY-like chemotaxis protein